MPLRGEIKVKLHSSHLGIESCLRRARECVFWPGMNAELKDFIMRCEMCQKHAQAQQRETIAPPRTKLSMGTSRMRHLRIQRKEFLGYSRLLQQLLGSGPTQIDDLKPSGTKTKGSLCKVRDTENPDQRQWTAIHQRRIPKLHEELELRTENVKPRILAFQWNG